ncbi:restriction endonuclease subunit S [Cellulophaga lytica]|uniref:restriction endonuclease subunit S n=1 Tax=Cellulophaga lytica TaxID=979 RepID=UPI003CE5156E
MQKEIQTVPQIRFSEFRESWSKFKFNNDNGLIHGDGDWILTEDISNNGEIRIVQLGSVGFGNLIDKELKTISKSSFEKINGTLLEAGDILINRMVSDNVYACIFDLEGKFVTSVDVCWIRESDYFNNKFIVNLLLTNNHQKKLLRLSSGSGRVRISKKNLFNKFDFFIPSIVEQQKIANFLTSIDTQIQTLEKKKILLEQYKKGVMQKIFKQELRFKEEDGNDFPKWEYVKLKEVLKRSKLKNTDLKVKYVLTNSATQGIVSQNDYFDKDIANKNNLQGYYIVEKDDFIYNPRISQFAPVGPLKRNKLAQGVMSPLYTVLRPKQGNLEFLEFYFETTLWHKYMKAIANYGARHDRMNITMTDFENLPIPFPSLEEQIKIANFLSAIDENIALVNNKIGYTKSYKKGLLQQMFV